MMGIQFLPIVDAVGMEAPARAATWATTGRTRLELVATGAHLSKYFGVLIVTIGQPRIEQLSV